VWRFGDVANGARRWLHVGVTRFQPSEMMKLALPLMLAVLLLLLRPRGLLVSANLFLAQFVPDLPGIELMAQYRQRIVDDERLLTAIVPGGLALSCLRGERAASG